MKYKLLRFSLLSMLVMFFGGNVFAETLTVDFEDETTAYTDWVFTNFTTKQTNSSVAAHGGSYFGTTGGKASGALTTKDKIAYPKSIQFFVSKTSTNTTASSWSVQVSSDGEEWTTVGDSQSAGANITKGTWTEVNRELKSYSNVYVRIAYEGSTAIRTIDDVTLTYSTTASTKTATTVTLSEGYATSGVVGGTIDLPSATVKAGDATLNAAVTWTSSNEDVAIIRDGVINLLKAGTSTIKASFAGDDTNEASSDSFEVTVYASYTTIAAMLENITATKTNTIYTFENLLVRYVNGSYTYVTDGKDNMLFYGKDLGLKAGDIINGNAKGQLYTYNALPELALKTADISVEVASSNNEVIPSIIELDALKNNINNYITIENATYVSTDASNAKKLAFKIGENSVVAYNQFNIDVTALEINKVYNITGFGGINNSTYQIYPTSISEQEEKPASFRDIKINLMEHSELLTGNNVYFTVAEDGTIGTTENAEEAAGTIKGGVHGSYGSSNFTASIPVLGCVKITYATHDYGNDIVVTNAEGAEVAKFNTMGAKWMSDPNNVVVAYYRINEPTTLNFSKANYNPYFAVEAIDESEIPAEVTNYTATFSKGDTDCEGEVPTALTVEAGSKVKIPANTTLYAEGKTLTTWTDGTNQYKAGDEITLAEDITLTPIFTANEATFADRTAEVTAIWDFQQKNGAPVLNYQNKTGFYVTQIVVNEKTIDFRLDFDTNNGGKIANGSWQDWCQINSGTKFVLPAYKGTTYSTFSMNDNSNTTFNGETGTYANYENTYTFNGSSDEMTIDIQGGSYYRWVKAVYPVPTQDAGGFVDIKADFTNQNFLTDEEKAGIADESNKNPSLNFGLSIGEDGSATRVASDAENANAVISGQWHSNEHGISNFSATVKVEGTVKITFGTCAWGGDVEVKNAEGVVVTTMNTNTGACYHGDKTANVVSCYYKQDAATTLTISGGSYVPYFAVEKVDPKDIPSDVKFIFDITESGAEGVAPAEEIAGIGKKYTLPKNFTLYKEGATLTGWTDGTNTYAPGEEITAPDAESVTLTPVFTENEVSLADRTEPVTLKWNFRRDAGAPTVGWENKDGLVWVTQATIGEKTIDVVLPFSTNPGKFANGNWTDWAQLNEGTTFHVPSCKGATVSIEAYNELTTTSIDGQTDYTSGKTINYTVASAAETVDVVIGNDGSYYRYIQVVLPVVQSQGGGKTYDNADAKVVWAMTDATNMSANVVTPDGIFSTAAVNTGDITLNGSGTGQATYPDGKTVTFIKLRPAGSTQTVEWAVKPAAGLTFKPTKISAYIIRFGTDAENGITISAKVGDGEAITLGNFTAPRNNKTQAEDKFGKNSNYTNHFEIELTAEQQAALASADGLSVFGTVGVGGGKDGGYAEMTIDGIINGTVADVNQYTLATVVSPEEAGSINVYPAAEQYEEGSEVTLTATENFGYDFVNWTNAAGDEVSTEAKFKYTMTADETLTANFRAVETYELALTIDGTNPYMVTISPAPTLVDGKMMYEAGTTVELNANQYDGLVTFTNWSDGETAANKIVKMDNNVTLSAIYAQADIIAGWDFYKAGGNGRKADFAAADNDADALSLVNTETGETQGWLDKSTEAAGGYESFKGAAVNWRTGSSNGDVGNWHWQTKVNAEAFTNITVQFQMLYNYNAYQRYNAEFSTDGENWTNFGSITMEGAKNPASFNETLPEAANNQKDLFIRMIADKTSNVDGSASANDGNALAMFFITGTQKLVDDPVAPALVSSVPADGATGASASGKIVLNFDKKVQVVEGAVATLGTMELTPTVSGKVITFEYKGLEYSKEYTFTLPANTVQNLTGATLADAIAINFTTMERPTIEKGLYDEVVSTAEELAAAIKAANERADKTTRYRIFIKKGTYALPSGANKHYTHTNSSTGEVYFNQDRPDPITYVTGGKISFIGEDRDATIITQAAANETFAGQFGTTSIYDGIGNSDVLQLSGDDYYFQDLTIKSGIEDARGRNLAVQDKSKKSIYKNVCLYGYQDTWTSNNDNGLYYFEGGIIRGRTDYICGKGDAYFDQVEFRQIAGGYCAVPSKPANIGWVMKDCVINGDGSGVDGNYTLGRPWGSGTPVAVWIDTKMNVVPSAIGWNEMGTGWPKRFAEYNSTTSTGSVIDLSGRKKTFGDGHTNNPVLTAEEALEYSNKDKMFGDWNPQLMTESAPMVTDVKLVGTILSWTGNSYSLLYAICKNGEIIAYTKDTTFDLSTLSSEEAGSRRGGEESVVYSVRAANEMGGLGEAAEAVVATGIEEIAPATTTADGKVYNLQGIRVDKAQKGLYIINGKKVVIK